ncbi:MAG: anti-sigma factor [Planctomycetota bacterium]
MSDQAKQRLLDLLADRATFDLDPAEAQELERLLGEHPDVDGGELDHAASVLQILAAGTEREALPSGLRETLAASASGGARPAPRTAAPAAPAPAPAPVPRPEPAQGSLLGSPWLGWLAAAAALLVIVLNRGGGDAPTPEVAREALLARATDLVQIDWTRTEDANAGEVSGEVVWSDREQEGYMLFRDLPVNDPGVNQYQLWIIDGERAEPQPIDGGVFDSPSGASTLVVPIDAKLSVGRAATFLVTLERPGGVVVSEAEHVLTTAAVQ